jgi:DNA-directed RNA polymerase subunit K/omega
LEHHVAESVFEEDPAKLLKERRGTYLMVNAVAKRVRELQLGEKSLALSPDGTRDPVKIATQEFVEGKLDIVTPESGQGEYDEDAGAGEEE